jgi:predicted DNA-binding antitoxin AbrB/MazE fold protein
MAKQKNLSEKVIKTVYEKGVFHPKKPVTLDEGQIVRIILLEAISTYIGQDVHF